MVKTKSGNFFSRHKILTVVLIIILIAVVANAAGGKKENTVTNDNKTVTKNEQKQAPKIGEVASDGKFEFVVKNVQCNQSSISDTSGYLTKQAQGQFCIVDISVKNTGDKQQLFLSSYQKLLNADKVEYSADDGASVYVNGSNNTFVSQINPGNTVEGKLVFDIPKDQTPVTAELHDSSLSSGVVVNLQ